MQDINFVMSRVMVIGIGPTPLEKSARKVYAPGLRLWNFIQVLRNEQIEVVVAEALFGEENVEVSSERKHIGGVPITWYTLSLDPEKASRQIRDILSKERVDGIIATTELMNAAVALSEVDLPKWFDFNGDPMAERQLQAYVYGSDAGLLAQWELMLPALISGDHFSTCSKAQKFALIGQLSVCGRLNKTTARHDLVDVLPPGPTHTELRPQSQKKVIRGRVVAEEDFVVLWTGGYNTWTDVDTLFKGLEYAMARDDTIRYVSTGGAIRGHDERTFERFREMVANSPYKERFYFADWVELAELPGYYYESDVAINIDSFSYEALLGCRNRLFDWIIAGLPVITTTMSEVTLLLAEKNLVASFPVGDERALGELLLDVAHNKQLYKERAIRAREFLLTEYTNDRLLAPLVRWAKNPKRAPDIIIRDDDTLQNTLMKAQQNMLKQGKELESLQERVDNLEARLRRIEGSRLFRIINKFKKF
ncbi:hypothetical protein J7M23_03985 [Candidatus Sumerlaeota bacterium]|nr:hypothetical protein [Candidatus Sumerlaeota bacterium]